jgi:uncharacterized protein (DUF433 family)
MPSAATTPTILDMTPFERRRRAKVRRILHLHRAGRTPREIAADGRVGYTPTRVRQILRAHGLTPHRSGSAPGPADDGPRAA